MLMSQVQIPLPPPNKKPVVLSDGLFCWGLGPLSAKRLQVEINLIDAIDCHTQEHEKDGKYIKSQQHFGLLNFVQTLKYRFRVGVAFTVELEAQIAF
jgi:hypothetical protein